MAEPNVRASVCRIAPTLDPERRMPVERSHWATGDYVVGVVEDPGSAGAMIELETGRMIKVEAGDRVVGALAIRHATLEATGSWKAIEDDGRFSAMTAAGVFGKITSQSPYVPRMVQLRYVGHCVGAAGAKETMSGHVTLPEPAPFRIPTILVVGSSMSAGKTATCRTLVRRLRAMDKRVIAGKLTGCGRYRDAQSMKDAGADWVYDFVDAGLPSTIGPRETITEALGGLLTQMARHPADVAVIEAGASPLEPYSGEVAVELLDPAIIMTILCASDPYAVLGIRHAFDRPFDMVAGQAANTLAAVTLVQRLSGLHAMNTRDPGDLEVLDAKLARALTD